MTLVMKTWLGMSLEMARWGCPSGWGWPELKYVLGDGDLPRNGDGDFGNDSEDILEMDLEDYSPVYEMYLVNVFCETRWNLVWFSLEKEE